MSTRQIRCPSCDGPMHPVERREVTIDLCRDCKGVFLDRGELDKLLDAVEAREEDAHRPESERFVRPYRDRDDDDDDDRYRHDRGARKKKRGGFLADLFEGGD